MYQGNVSVTHQHSRGKAARAYTDKLCATLVRYVRARRGRRVVWWIVRWVQWPVLLGRRVLWGLVWSLNWWDIIDAHILLGGALMFDDLARLQRQGVGAVVNLCKERSDNQQRLQACRMAYLWLPVPDTRAPTVGQILEGLAWMEWHVGAGQKVYLHCAAGMGRSVTLLACWYLYTERLSVPQVLTFVRKRRPQTALTRRQVQRIEEIAALLTHTAGTLPTPPAHG